MGLLYPLALLISEPNHILGEAKACANNGGTINSFKNTSPTLGQSGMAGNRSHASATLKMATGDDGGTATPALIVSVSVLLNTLAYRI